MTVLINGGGIAGLALALTCHQIGVPFKVFEATPEIKPMGVGINVQPTAVRELFDLGLEDKLSAIGVRTREYGLYSKHGLHIWTEARGTDAGYDWPQFSVHRGKLLIMLYETLLERAGPDCIETGWRATGFSNVEGGAVLHLQGQDGETREEAGSVIIAADGIHSAIRAQMAPDEGPAKWGGNILWRGTALGKPYKSGASMVLIGYTGLRFVSYPISEADPETGLATINWIANLKFADGADFSKEDWNRQANLDDFLPQFEHFNLDWIDIPGLIEASDEVLEYPMVDRDPLPRWTDGRVTLMGDAAHPAYPVGSNGAGSAILDARRLGAAFLSHGLTQVALEAYEADMRPVTNAVTLMNRVAGPDTILDVVEARSGGKFEHINDVIPQAELAAHADKYKSTAGTSVADTNARPRTIPEGARFAG
ncbi:Monooxygenase family protein [Sulfitobacter noctilucae]|uniref:flavin-dependent oxidoreductase n=1 Tax=Sulfitobacter noctilucae TaxID=1342302 RepID=UPI0004685696|nr:flavin-dependent oxidoreductase [Sulfitobacter noctilucae]KIN60660.1 Monooxygenase family protein [Sulfitobacter noctilucae]